MRKVYETRRTTMLAAFDEHFGDRATITGTESGMHVLVNIQGVTDADAFMDSARKQGVGIYSARPYYLGEPPPGASFLMGYSSVSEDGIRRGIAILAGIAGR
jgi:GntR family transcriptional regulator/MocR family aminotransferase